MTVKTCAFLFLSLSFSVLTHAVTVDIRSDGAWPGGYSKRVVITNDQGGVINGWELKLGLAAGKVWRAQASSLAPLAVSAASYNARIASDESTDFGFSADGVFRVDASTSCRFNGDPCELLVDGQALVPAPKPDPKPAPTATGKLKHPGMLSSLADLQAIKNHVTAGRQPWTAQVEALKRVAADATLRTPPPKAIYCSGYNKDPQGNKVPACDWVVENGIDAYSMALLGYLTGQRTHSDKAIQFIMQWADGDFKGFDPAGTNALLQAGWAAPWFANAAEILRYTYSGWKPQHTTAVNSLLNQLLPQVSDEQRGAPNNWLHARIEAHMAIAIWRDDDAMFRKALTQWRNNAPSYFYIASDGAFPPEPHERRFEPSNFKSRWWSGAKKFVPGMTMETCRDINHQSLGVRAIVNGMAMAKTQGTDVLAGTDMRERLTTFLETQAQWIKNRAEPAGMCDAAVIFQPPSTLMRDAEPIGYPMARALLATASKPLPNTKAANKAAGAIAASRWLQKWETLTHPDLQP